MPFTFAHPAAAVPLARLLGRRGVLSALVIGSIVPDLAVVFPIGLQRLETHSASGLFWFCIPAGLVGYLWFHAFAKSAVVWLMPEAIRVRLESAPEGRSGFPDLPPAAVILSLLLGSVSHIAWDSFTHRNGVAVEALGLLRVPLSLPWGWDLPLYRLLQYGSGVFGLALLAVWSWRWLRTAIPEPSRPEPSSWSGWRPLWAGAIAAVVAASCLISVVRNQPRVPFPASIPILVTRVAIVCVGSLVVSAVAYSFLWRLLMGWESRRESP